MKLGVVVIANRTLGMTKQEALTLDTQPSFVDEKNRGEQLRGAVRLAVNCGVLS